jgi:hypothetical protein
MYERQNRQELATAEKMVGDGGSVCGLTCIVQMDGGKGNSIAVENGTT